MQISSSVHLPGGSADNPISIRTLGGLSIWQADASQPLHFETRTVEALLVYLACHGRPLHRDALAELLWPERTQEQARSNLRVAIHRLRQRLEPYLHVSRQSIALASTALIHVDCSAFEHQLAAGDLDEAVARYDGDFLDGFYLDSSPAFEQWILLERERLRNLAISAYQQLVTEASARGQAERAIGHAEGLLRLDPLHEPTYRQLMRLLAGLGRRTAALTQYTTCCQLLEQELGVTPDETTTALYEQIRAGTLTATLAEGAEDEHSAGFARPLVSLQDPLLPPQSTTFIGRATELAQIGNLLANPDCRLLTLLGVGGIGKTRLAVEAAGRHRASFADGVCYVSLAPVGTADLVTATLAQRLGIQPGSSNLLGQICDFLRPRQLLLILDNFEHLLEAAEVVAHLLNAAPHVKVLVTSRERLYLLEEWLFPIPGLSVTEGVTGEARLLFVRTAQRVQPDFVPDGQEAAILAICRQVEGMPLALELAASWVRVMPCAAIAQQLQHNLDLLTTSLRNLPERHRNMHSLFDQSWRLLAPHEQGVLMRLSVFRGGCALEQAAEIAGATLPLLLSLVEKSLVRSAGQGRFDLHELVRQYAAAQLAASGEVERLRQRHFVVYLQFVRTADRHLRGPEAAVWYQRLEDEHGNVRAALRWVLGQERYVDAAWLAVAVHHFWYAHGHWYEAAKVLEPLLAHRQVLAVDLRLATMVAMYTYWRALENFAPIDFYSDEFLQLLEMCPHDIVRAAGWQISATSTSDLARAFVVWEKCITLLRTALDAPKPEREFGAFGDAVYRLAEALFRYAIRLIDVGEYEQAAQVSSESIELFQRQGNCDFIAFSYCNLGRLSMLRGDFAHAHTLFSEALTTATAVGNVLALTECMPRLGMVALFAGDAAEARRLLTETLQICMGRTNVMVLARIYTYLAETALWEGMIDDAEHWLVQSLTHHAQPRWIRLEFVDCLWVAARVAAARQQYARAATLFGLAEQVGNQIRYASIAPVRVQIDAALASVRAAMTPEHFAAAFDDGGQMTLDEAFATVLAPTQITSR